MRHTIVLICSLAVIAACGDSESDPTTPPGGPTSTASDEGGSEDIPDTSSPPETTTPQSTEDNQAESPAPAVGEGGTFTVNEIEFAVNLLNRCIPFSDSDDDIDLQALAQGAKLNLVLIDGTTEVSVDGTAIGDEFGSVAFGSDPAVTSSEVTEGRWSGLATVGDSMGSGETVEISWDVMIPQEIRDCGL